MHSHLSYLDQSVNYTIDDLSVEKAETLAPSIVYLCILMIVGVIGNAFVLIIFYFRFSATTHRTFILTLASYDFCACAVGAPFAVGESFVSFTYYDEVSCKLLRFVLYYTCVASSLTLVLIAIERCRKICRPLKPQFTVLMAKKAIFVVAGVISFLSSSPAFILYGNFSIETGFKNMTGTKCFIKDDYNDTIWPITFNVYLLGLAFISTAIMSVCYFRIARAVAKLGKENVSKRMKSSQSDGKSYATEASVNSVDDYSVDDNISPELPSVRSVASNMSTASSVSKATSTSQDNKGLKGKIRQKSSRLASKILRRLSSKTGRKTIRITKMLTFVTVAFVLSYLPHLSLMIWSLLTDNVGQLPQDNAYQFMFYSFLFNNLVNPFIYAAMDLKFRNELKKLLKCEFNFTKVS